MEFRTFHIDIVMLREALGIPASPMCAFSWSQIPVHRSAQGLGFGLHVCSPRSYIYQTASSKAHNDSNISALRS